MLAVSDLLLLRSVGCERVLLIAENNYRRINKLRLVEKGQRISDRERRKRERKCGREFENRTEKNFVRESLRKKDSERMRMQNREVRMSERVK